MTKKKVGESNQTYTRIGAREVMFPPSSDRLTVHIIRLLPCPTSRNILHLEANRLTWPPTKGRAEHSSSSIQRDETNRFLPLGSPLTLFFRSNATPPGSPNCYSRMLTARRPLTAGITIRVTCNTRQGLLRYFYTELGRTGKSDVNSCTSFLMKLLPSKVVPTICVVFAASKF